MSADKQQPIDTSELLDDIHYVNHANKEEIIQINNRLRLLVSEADLPGSEAEAIINEVSSQLGQLSVKVKLAEKAIRSIQPGRTQKPVAGSAKLETRSKTVSMQFGAAQLIGNRNLLTMERSGNGVSYVWTASDPEIIFSFSLDRSKSLGMQIRLFALVKPEFSKQLKVLVDGAHIKHSFSVDEGLYVVSCTLPPSSGTGRTEIKIVLPSTHSPMELGGSPDGRKLGIAISEIRFGKPEGGFTRVLKRLKLR